MNIDDQPKIKVVVRKRPMNKKEISRNQQDVVEVRDGCSVIVRELKQKVDLTKFIDEHHFTFDSAFGETATNDHIYQQCVRPIVQCAFLGAKVTCFAYGQTGSGKTYTMNGDGSRNPGMYVLGAQDIFALVEQPQFRHLGVSMSFYEIYCGKLFDLLNSRQILQAREDSKQNVNIIGLTEKKIANAASFMQVIEQGSSVRITSQNSTNADSSRSHAILQISLLDGKKPFGKISFIDLAGCERGADTIDQNKQTRIDGAQINKSLLALKQCIRALDNGKAHTPFRGSKLTMVLKDSFTGFCKTLMIGNISPNSFSCENTLNTLRYADRVKELKKPTGEPISKEDQLAKELMLPRMLKNKQTVEINSDGEEEPVNKAPVPPRPKEEQVYRKPEPQMIKSHRDYPNPSQQPQMLMRRNTRKSPLKDENCENLFDRNQRKGVSTAHGPAKPKPNNKANANQHDRSSVRNSFTANLFQNNNNNSSTTQQYQQTPFQRPTNNKNSGITTKGNLTGKNAAQLRSQQTNQPTPPLRTLNSHSGLPMLYTPLLEQSDYRQWQRTLQEFGTWDPNQSSYQMLPVMTQKFEVLVKNIMRQEVEVLELHKNQIQLLQEELGTEELNLYNSVVGEEAPNESYLNYVENLQSLLDKKVKAINALQQKLGSYKYHLQHHIASQKKLFKASEDLMRLQEIQEKKEAELQHAYAEQAYYQQNNIEQEPYFKAATAAPYNNSDLNNYQQQDLSQQLGYDELPGYSPPPQRLFDHEKYTTNRSSHTHIQSSLEGSNSNHNLASAMNTWGNPLGSGHTPQSIFQNVHQFSGSPLGSYSQMLTSGVDEYSNASNTRMAHNSCLFSHNGSTNNLGYGNFGNPYLN